jgi:hypothetical protein
MAVTVSAKNEKKVVVEFCNFQFLQDILIQIFTHGHANLQLYAYVTSVPCFLRLFTWIEGAQ